MLIKKETTNDSIKVLYESSNIICSEYNNNNNDLDIIFKNGGKYRYKNVSKSDYMRFEIADSQGVVFSKNIKQYPFEKIETVDVTNLITEVETIKSIENQRVIDLAEESLRETMSSLVNYGLTVSGLTNLKPKIDEFINLLNK